MLACLAVSCLSALDEILSTKHRHLSGTSFSRMEEGRSDVVSQDGRIHKARLMEVRAQPLTRMNVKTAGGKGGHARAKKLSKKRRVEIAKIAAKARWRKRK